MTKWSVVRRVAIAACGSRSLPLPANRTEACARIDDPSVLLARGEFGKPGGAARCGTGLRGAPTICIEYGTANQSVYEHNSTFPPNECFPENGGTDCPSWRRCERCARPEDDGGVRNWCVPGPVCRANAGVR